MNINFNDLPSFNRYLFESIKAIDNSQNKHSDLNDLIQVVCQNEGLLQDKNSSPQDVVKYLQLSAAVRKIVSFEAEGNSDIEKVMRSASAVLSRLGTKFDIPGEEKPVDTFSFLYNRLIRVDREICLQTLAGWIDQNKIPIKSLELPEDLLFDLAPRLKYLDLTDGDNFSGWYRTFTDEFVGALLAKTEQLTKLKLKNSNINGSAFAHFKNTQQLVSLSIQNCPHFNHPLPENLENLEKLTISGCAAFKQPLPTGMNKLESFSCYGPYLEARTVLNFLLPMIDESQSQDEIDRGFLLADGLFERIWRGYVDYSGGHVLSIYDYFIKQKPEQIDSITALIERVKPQNLRTSLLEKVVTVTGDPLQNIYICQIATELDKSTWDNFELINAVLVPLMKTPMDPPLQQFYERLGSLADPKAFLEFLKDVKPPERMLDGNTYLDLLAGWIAKDKVPLKSLRLSDEAILELAPHLTYLDLNEDEKNKVLRPLKPRFEKEFLGKLLSKTENIAVLKAESSPLDGETFLRLYNTRHLQLVQINNCPSLQRDIVAKFALPIYFSNRLLGVSLVTMDGSPINETELLTVYFTNKNPHQREAIVDLMQRTAIGTLGNCVFRKEIPFVNDDLLKNDPLQQLYLYQLFSELSSETSLRLRTLLEPLIKTPMDASLNQFYEFMNVVPFALLDRVVNFVSSNDFNRDAMIKFIPYLIHDTGNQPLLEQNLKLLMKTGQLGLFFDKFPPSKVTASLLTTEDLFTEDSEENERVILELFEYDTRFTEKRKLNPIRDIPIVTLESWAEKLKGLIKLHFHELVTVQEFQEVILRTFPPSKPENLALYPMQSCFVYGKLEIHVVPTLPVADAPRLLKTIVHSKDIHGIEIDYYGSPGADHSGLGRQFVSEVMQGYVVDQKSLFIKSAGGGMYPYDPTHKLGANAHRESYKDLGMFLGMTLQWGYPTGLILSEKTINGMLAFSGLELYDHEFNIKQFVANMDAASFINFMKEATIEDENSVKLYENILLSDNPKVILASAIQLNDLLGDEVVDSWIAGGAVNIKNIQERLRTMWVEDNSYSLTAVYAMAQGMKKRLPKKIGDHDIDVWDDVRRMGTAELSKHLQGELTAQYVKEHMHVRVIGGETPEKRETADNVRKWTDEWIDANGDDPEKLANFVQAFSGARAMTKDIYLDINPEYKTIVAHTCFNRTDIPVGVKEGFLKLMWDDFARGNFKFDVA